MLKRISFFLFFILLIISSSCHYGQITVSKDRFRNMTVVSLKQEIDSYDENQESKRAEFTFVKELKNNRIINMKLYFKLTMDEGDEELSDKLYMQVDKDTYEIKMKEKDKRSGRTSRHGYNEEPEYFYPAYPDNIPADQVDLLPAKFVDFTKRDKVVKEEKHITNVYIDKVVHYKGVLLLNKEIYSGFFDMKTFVIRLYYGPNPLTYDFSEEHIDLIYEFMRSDEFNNVVKDKKTRRKASNKKKDEIRNSKLLIGLKGGVGFGLYDENAGAWKGTVKDDWSAFNEILVSGKIGLFADIGLVYGKSAGLSLQVELMFNTQSGGMYNGSQGTTITAYDFTQFDLGLLIPIYLKPRFKAGPGDFFFLFGPEHFIVFRRITDISYEQAPTYNVITSSTEESYMDIRLGIGLGFGYDFIVGPGKLEIGATYSYYILSYLKNDKNYRHNFTFDIGYAFKAL